jgi:hypothetical protein
MKIWYSVDIPDSSAGYMQVLQHTYELKRWREAEEVVRICAENFYYAHGGASCTWPRLFSLRKTEDGPEVVKCSVDLEMDPMFVPVWIKVGDEVVGG